MSSNIIGSLKSSANGPWVTFKEAKGQIRAAAREAGIKLGSFRPRSLNRAVLQVALADGSGHVTAHRRPNAPIEIVKTADITVTDPELIAQIEAELGTAVKRGF